MQPGTFCTIPESLVELPILDNRVTYVRQYPIPHILIPIMDKGVDKWKQEGIVVQAPIDCSFNNPLTIGPKKDADGNITLEYPCLDPRHLNKLLPDDRYPIPLIKDIFETLSGAVIFSTLDLKNAYHCFHIKFEDQYKTTFTWRNEQLMFVDAPFGLKPISSKFQRVIHIIL